MLQTAASAWHDDDVAAAVVDAGGGVGVAAVAGTGRKIVAPSGVTCTLKKILWPA